MFGFLTFSTTKKRLISQMSRTIGVAGFEPAHDGVKVRCLTAWLYPNDIMEDLGFEPRNPKERIYSPSRLASSLILRQSTLIIYKIFAADASLFWKILVKLPTTPRFCAIVQTNHHCPTHSTDASRSPSVDDNRWCGQWSVGRDVCANDQTPLNQRDGH